MGRVRLSVLVRILISLRRCLVRIEGLNTQVRHFTVLLTSINNPMYKQDWEVSYFFSWYKHSGARRDNFTTTQTT